VQIAETGVLHDYGAATPYWREIVADERLDWEEYRKAYGPIREGLCDRLAALASRR